MEHPVFVSVHKQKIFVCVAYELEETLLYSLRFPGSEMAALRIVQLLFLPNFESSQVAFA